MSDLGTSPFVSVIMANRNGGSFIEAAITSALSQTHQHLEVILADDGSTDDSLRIAEKIADTDGRLKVLRSTESVGPGAARNKGIEIARGEWIAILDSDDLFHPRRLERLLALAETSSAHAIADDLIHFSSGKPGAPERLFSGTHFDETQNLGLEELLAKEFEGAPNRLGYLKPIFGRQALGDLRYREDLRVGEDFDLLMRFAATGRRLTVVPEGWYLYRRHCSSISHRLDPKDAAQMVRAMTEFRDTFAPLPHEVQLLAIDRVRELEKVLAEETLIKALKSFSLPAALATLTKAPGVAGPVASKTMAALRRRLTFGGRRQAHPRPLLVTSSIRPKDYTPTSWDRMDVCQTGTVSCEERAKFTAAVTDAMRPVLIDSCVNPDLLGFAADRDGMIVLPNPLSPAPLVHVRTPTYKRPQMLKRALKGLQAQSIEDWVCDVYDDDDDEAGRAIVEELADPRIRYNANRPQRLASRNIDFCFTRFNPHGAKYFCVLEDDNQLLPRFLEDNIALCREQAVEIVLRNQLTEHNSGTEGARLSKSGLLQEKLPEGICEPEVLHLSVMADMGVSNGALFWTADAKSDLEIGVDCTATFQEYLRTISIVEPVYVALEPLAIWAENGEGSVRDLGNRAGWFRREIDLKRSVQVLQRRVWQGATFTARKRFLNDPAYSYPSAMRATGLVKSLSQVRIGDALPVQDVARLVLRGTAVRIIGRPMRGLDRFVSDRLKLRRRQVSQVPF